MSDQNVTVKVGAKAEGDLKKPFNDLAAGAKMADDAVLRPVDRIKDMGRELKSGEKGLKNFQSGLFGLAASASLVDDRLAKLTIGMHSLHSATQLVRGAGALGGLAGGALVPIAAAIAAVGAVAFATSSTLQDKLGNALYKMSDAAKEAEARLRRLKDTQEDIATARRLGVGTHEEEQKLRGDIGVRAPFLERGRALGEDRARAMDRARALGMFPDSGTDPTREALANLHGSPADNEVRLRGLAGSGFQPPAALRRELFGEEAARDRGQQEAAGLRGQMGDFAERQAISKRLAEISAGPREAIKTINEEMKKAKQDDQGFANWHHIAGVRIAGFGAEADQAAMQRRKDELERQVKANAPEAARLHAQLGGRGLVTGAAEGEDLNRQLEASADRLRASEEKILEIKQKINQAEVEHLRAIQASTAEQAKLAAQAVKEEEAKLRGTKTNLGLMSGTDLLQALQVSRKIAGGQDLGDADLRFARGQDAFRPAVEAQGLRRAETNPIIQEILKNVGADQKLQQAKEAQTALVKLDAELKHQIDVKVQADSAQMAKDIQEQLVPGLTKSIQEATQGLGRALEVKVAQEVQKQLITLRDNQPR